jgi:hypothetical protein
VWILAKLVSISIDISMKKSSLTIGKNIHDSKIIDIWFTSIGYMLISSALFLLSKKQGYEILMPSAIISYIFSGIKVIHGTRQPYEYLKNIYFSKNKYIKTITYLFLFSFRMILIVIPVIIWFLGNEYNKVVI